MLAKPKKNGTGLSQKKQIEIIKDFSEGNYNVLVSSSVGEEGLDIPQVDNVIFYEPIPSAIRHIQRRGRTARMGKGEVQILMTLGTRDEAYRWTAHHKEKRMYRTLETLQKNMVEKKINPPLSKFMKKKKQAIDVTIYADVREKGKGVIKQLIDAGVKIKLEKLEVGDYICGQRCGVEYKTTDDFVNSLIDGRLLTQIKELKQSFEKPLIIIEGINDIYSIRNIHPNAIRGIFTTITVSYGIPILYTKNFKDTAAMLLTIAKREQDANGKHFSAHRIKKPSTLKEQQEFIVSALPNIGPNLAIPLLKKFKSIINIINASEDELKSIELIGEKKAKAIKDVAQKEYID